MAAAIKAWIHGAEALWLGENMEWPEDVGAVRPGLTYESQNLATARFYSKNCRFSLMFLPGGQTLNDSWKRAVQ
jgi:hypothetical protein